MRRWALALGALLVLGTCPAVQARILPRPKRPAARLAKRDRRGTASRNGARSVRSVVQITSGAGNGSGVLYQSRAAGQVPRILTANHVVSRLEGHGGAGPSQPVELPEGDIFHVAFSVPGTPVVRARKVGSHAGADVAVLELLDPLPAGVKTMPLSPRRLRRGEAVTVLGHPYGGAGNGLDPQLSTGTVTTSSAGSIQTDASVAPGVSGGPIMDRRGQAAGILLMQMQGSGATYGIGRSMHEIAQYLARVEQEHIPLSDPGFWYTSMRPQHAYEAHLPASAVMVTAVDADSVAGRSGLRGGDVIVGIEIQRRGSAGGAETVKRIVPAQLSILNHLTRTLAPGASVRVEIVREGQRREVRMGAHPVDENAARAELARAGIQLKRIRQPGLPSGIALEKGSSPGLKSLDGRPLDGQLIMAGTLRGRDMPLVDAFSLRRLLPALLAENQPTLTVFGKHEECGNVHPYPVPLDKAALQSLVDALGSPRAGEAGGQASVPPPGAGDHAS
jgi:S1-C subfamily serine protease